MCYVFVGSSVVYIVYTVDILTVIQWYRQIFSNSCFKSNLVKVNIKLNSLRILMVYTRGNPSLAGKSPLEQGNWKLILFDTSSVYTYWRVHLCQAFSMHIFKSMLSCWMLDLSIVLWWHICKLFTINEWVVTFTCTAGVNRTWPKELVAMFGKVQSKISKTARRSIFLESYTLVNRKTARIAKLIDLWTKFLWNTWNSGVSSIKPHSWKLYALENFKQFTIENVIKG